MNGKILKISSNDLYGNVDERSVAAFAAFTHKKYMNKYVIFTFDGEFDKKKLYFGSLHLKKNTIVVFAVTEATKKYIKTFVDSYITNTIDSNEYELVDISAIEKIELVSYNDCDYDRLEELDKMSIERIIINEEEETIKVQKIFLAIILVIMLVLLGGITYLYFFPQKFTTEYNQIECKNKLHNYDIKMDYQSYKIYKFDKANMADEAEVTDTYTFANSNEYYEFKNNHKESDYFHVNGEYKYDDKYLTITLMYREDAPANTYDELTSYLKKEGYKCEDGKYYE